MLEFFRTHTRLLMFILVPLIIGSFVFVQGYSSMMDTQTTEVARVARRDITQGEWDLAYRGYLDQTRMQAPRADPRLYDTPEARMEVLERMVLERTLLVAAEKSHFSASDDRLLRTYLHDPRFAGVRLPDGSVNRPLLETVLSQRGMTLASFERDLRQELTLRQVTAGLTDTVFAAVAPTATALDAMFQQREVQIERFEAKSYVSKVKPSEADIDAYYKDPANVAQFKTTEKVDIEYVVLDVAAFANSASVPEEEVKKFYDGNEKRFTAPEERRPSQILLKADKGTSKADREALKAKAEALLVELKKNPASFPQVAKQSSQDASSEQGGALDLFIGRGDTDPSYEKALFALKQGELSGVIDTPDGFYILRLDEARGGKRSFESVREEIQKELAAKLSRVRFVEAKQEFTDLLSDQSDTLKPVADKFKLEVKTAKGVMRAAPEQGGPLASKAFLDALFSAEVLNSKHNTDAIPLDGDQLVAGRVVVHTPSETRPLAEVSSQIKEALVQVQAAAAARKEGEARLQALRASADAALSSSPQILSRAQTRELPREVLDAVLKASPAPLPALIGVDLPGQGYVVAKVTKILPERDPVAADVKLGQAQYAQAWAEAQSKAYVEALKTRFGVKISATKPVRAQSEADASDK